MPGTKGFDYFLQSRMSKEDYHAAKSRAGSMSSSAGKPRPSSKANMQKARLFSPQLVGQSVTITPKHDYIWFKVGRYYEWEVVEEGEGQVVESHYPLRHTTLTAQEVWEHFKVIKKGKQ